ncbi:MAG: FAD-dependent oxidoreductase [Myxococcales bacterium]|nr:FAD-dependent oxidoreductase [Myxococcales bacterium]MCB9578535.1 FAD-dependent oxidoreductase [Polyangiaceae bacterium]
MLDVVVIGGGPAGAATAAELARRGRRVRVLEREQFPRFHVGESLLPCSLPFFERLGVVEELDARFVKKYGAEFVTHDGQVERRYSFAEGMVPHPASAWHAERSELDDVLLRAAERAGAEIDQGSDVRAVETSAAGARLRVRKNGAERELAARFVVDASGQGALLGRLRNIRKMDPVLKNAAVFAHFEGAFRHEGERGGDVTIVVDPAGWWWMIPLAKGRSSVGFVGPKRAFVEHKADAAGFAARIAKTPLLRERLADARRVAPVRSISDFSYSCRPVSGDGYLLVGDAAAFLDPVFSTGIHLGLMHGFSGAEAIDRALSKGDVRRARFRGYERFVESTLASYRAMVRGFYTPELVELLFSPSDSLDLRRAITTLLAGAGTDQLAIAWRVRVFRALARANKHVPLVPRLPGYREERA